jgi:hypothetical protein
VQSDCDGVGDAVGSSLDGVSVNECAPLTVDDVGDGAGDVTDVSDVNNVDDAGDITSASVEDGGFCDGVGDAVGSSLDGVSVNECVCVCVCGQDTHPRE